MHTVSTKCSLTISVIVPIYNVEKYLDICIESITSQTYKDIEVILVDDGSTDGSGEICDIWENKDERIKVIHKVNGGLSDARNYGIEQATGEYLTFIDSDDFILPNYLEYLHNLIIENNADLSVCQRLIVDEEGKILKKVNTTKEEKVITGKYDCMFSFLTTSEIDTVAWGKLYKTSLFKSDIRYPVGKYHEDVWTTYRYILKCLVIAIGSEALYAYRMRSGSIINSPFSPKHLDGIKGSIERYNEIINVFPSLQKEAAVNIIYSANQCMLRLGKTKGYDASHLNYLKEIYKKYFPIVLQSQGSIKLKVFASVARFVPNYLLKIILKLN